MCVFWWMCSELLVLLGEVISCSCLCLLFGEKWVFLYDGVMFLLFGKI